MGRQQRATDHVVKGSLRAGHLRSRWQDERHRQLQRASPGVSLCPFDGSAAEDINAVWQGMALAGVAVSAGKHNGLNATVQLRQCHLHIQAAIMWSVPLQTWIKQAVSSR